MKATASAFVPTGTSTTSTSTTKRKRNRNRNRNRARNNSSNNNNNNNNNENNGKEKEQRQVLKSSDARNSPFFQKQLAERKRKQKQEEEEKKEGQKGQKKNPNQSAKKRSLKLSQGHSEMTVRIIEKLASSSYECMICFGVVGKRAVIWSCSRCFAIFHFSCIREWHQTSSAKDVVDVAEQHDDWMAEQRVPAPSYHDRGRHERERPRGRTPISLGDFADELDDLVAPRQSSSGVGETSIASKANQLSGVASSSNAVDELDESELAAWSCPGCRNETSSVPRAGCYCGKEEEVEYTPFLIAHSCGSVCGRSLRSDGELAPGVIEQCCTHACPLRCHPGACPPCAALGPLQHCHCRRREYRLRCSDGIVLQSCEATCDGTLDCGTHRCARPCHEGSCAPCAESVEQDCYCGAQQGVAQRCGTGEPDGDGAGAFSCEAPCGRELECGAHRCEQLCHAGKCAPCALAPERVSTCYCGRTPVVPGSRETCRDPMPVCRNACRKMLACGQHRCTSKCHAGECKPCAKMVDVPCRCGRSAAKRPCALMQRVAEAARANAGESHIAEAYAVAAAELESLGVCWPGSSSSAAASSFSFSSSSSSPPALRSDFPIECGRKCTTMLSCGRHRCNKLCCSDDRDVHLCLRNCSKKLRCGRHTCEALCHSGKCRPCLMSIVTERSCRCGATVEFPPIRCGKAPAKCLHPCSREHACDHEVKHRCHRGPDSDCAPCVERVDRWCMGNHLQRTVYCYVEHVSCGRVCNLQLPCGLHTCSRQCHPPPCVPLAEGSSDPDLRRPCGSVCGRELANCAHRCKAACHPGDDCPLVVCQEEAVLRCACGRLTKRVVCGRRSGPFVDREPDDARHVPCDEGCRAAARNRKLAEAFGINVDSPLLPPSTSAASHRYAQDLLDLAATFPSLLVRIENTFAYVVDHPEDRDPVAISGLDSVQRRFVHELATFYGLRTQSIGGDDDRRVLVFWAENAHMPPALLSRFVSTIGGARAPSASSAAAAMPHVAGMPRASVSSPAVSAALPSGSSLKPSSFALHLYNLRADTKTRHIQAPLRGYEGTYKLKWIDDHNAMLFFADRNHMLGAKYVLDNGIFNIKEVTDVRRDKSLAAGTAARYHAPSAPWAASSSSSSSPPANVAAAAAALPTSNVVSTWEQSKDVKSKEEIKPKSEETKPNDIIKIENNKDDDDDDEQESIPETWEQIADGDE
jgi:R3H domain/NF-X1 type zinc finger